ncbi:hypothetical protein F5882DRAFT_343723 [Hyaloscypha sp. PMI_1271]|nr:hypothetical protein F5882DRAFT_343723 [Hyaloscypha sp. PMI_1271]
MLAVCPSHWKAFDIEARKDNFFDRGFVVQYKLTNEDFRLPNPYQEVDFKVLAGWLTNCRERHDKCGQSVALESTVPMFLIDCETSKIVQGTSDMKYAALSYVWGTSAPQKDTPESLVVDGLVWLPAQLPALHSDTWADRYCVSENDHVLKHRQIGSMDQVYSHAEFTIISLGKNPIEGLPGVSMRNVRIRPREAVGGYCFAATLRDPFIEIDHSIWNQRAWTFQEAFLSKRKLFFTAELVVYECTTHHRSEALENDKQEGNLSMEDWPLTFLPGMESQTQRQPSFNLKPQFKIEDLRYCLELYQLRSLTYESDALNGFLGILSKYEKGPHSIQHYWGLPLGVALSSRIWNRHEDRRRRFFEASRYTGSPAAAASAEFAASLSWELWTNGRGKSFKRRQNFPSWSWTGWKDTSCSPCCSIWDVTDAVVEIERKNGEIWPLEKFLSIGGLSLPPSELSTFIHIEARSTPVRILQIDDEEVIGEHFRSSESPQTSTWVEFTSYREENTFCKYAKLRDVVATTTNCTALLISDKRQDGRTCEHILLLVQDGISSFERIDCFSVLSSVEGDVSVIYGAFRTTAIRDSDGTLHATAWMDMSQISWTRRKIRLG